MACSFVTTTEILVENNILFFALYTVMYSNCIIDTPCNNITAPTNNIPNVMMPSTICYSV